MKEGKEPLRVRGIYVGSYDSMSCPVCKYYYFTEKEYDLALDNARSLGVVGPPLTEISSIITSVKISICPFYHIDKPVNLNIRRTINLVELSPITPSHDDLILAPQALDIGK